MNFINRYNSIAGLLISILTAIFGIYWYLFVAYLFLNVLDWLSGWYKARKLGEESSKVGIKGIIKKVGYWIIITVSFLMPAIFINLGHDMLGINLDFLLMLGWFTLACLLVNEIRSILENLVECGYRIPVILIKGLAVTDKLLNSKTIDEKKDQNNNK